MFREDKTHVENLIFGGKNMEKNLERNPNLTIVKPKGIDSS